MTSHRDDRFLGRVAVGIQLLCVVLIGAIALGAGRDTAQPELLPRPLIVLAAYAGPAIVGWLGVRRREPSLLVAAAATTFAGSFIAFSGVTLIFLVPAVLFAAGAVALEAAQADGRREDGVVAGLGRLLAAALIAALLLGAGAAALLVTDSACWNTYPGVSGPTFEMLPFSNELSPPPGATSAGCSTGLISVRGVALAGILWVAAVGLADLASRRRPGLPAGARTTSA